MAKSSTQYLRFCNYLLLCTKRTMDYLEAGVGILSDAVGARPDQAPYSDGYFMDTFARIHKESYDMDGVSDGKEGFAYDCPACGFVRMVPRLEFLLVHLQDYHNEDVGCTVEEESVGRSIHPRSWRCSQCLINNEPVYGWVCEFCMVFCEQSRINARIKLLEKVTSKRPDTNTMRKDLTPAQAFPIASSQPIQKEVTSLPGIFPSGIESHAFPRQPPLPQTQTSDTIILNAVTTVMGRGPNSGETGHRGGSVGSRQPSHLELATFELYCLETGCALRFKTSAQLEIHLEESHKLSDNMLMGW
jgi:hypothetical protein